MNERSPDPLWTLITVSYNSEVEIAKFWSAERPTNVEWIVVDNASSDSSVRAAEAAGASLVVKLEKNVGFGAANNAGLAIAQGKFIAFVNPDVQVDFESLDALTTEITANGGLVSPQLVNEDGSLQPNGRGFPTLWNKVRHRLKGSEDFPDYVVFAKNSEVRYVCWTIGAAVAGTAETLRSLGGWDEKFFVYYEDSDLGMRAWAAGHTVRLLGDVRWVHGWARETTRFSITPWRLEIASMATFYRRYPELLLPLAAAARKYPKTKAKYAALASS